MQRCCPPVDLDQTDRSADSALFKALSDSHRLAIIATLARAQSEICVCDLTAGLPLNQPTVSHHLRLLREAQLVHCTRRGTWGYYRLADDARARIDAALNALIPERSLA